MNTRHDLTRRFAFAVGDMVFLSGVGAATTALMHLMHDTRWSFALCLLLGMVAAMLLQTLMALVATPLLGSIEAMIPSMALAMIAPMSVCALHLADREPTLLSAALGGALFGVAVFLWVQFYGVASRHRLGRYRSGEGFGR